MFFQNLHVFCSINSVIIEDRDADFQLCTGNNPDGSFPLQPEGDNIHGFQKCEMWTHQIEGQFISDEVDRIWLIFNVVLPEESKFTAAFSVDFCPCLLLAVISPIL